LKQRRMFMAEKLGVNLADHPEMNFEFLHDHPDIAPFGFGSTEEYEDAVALFGTPGVKQVNDAMSQETTGYGNVAQAMQLAERVGITDPTEFIRIAKAVHSVKSSNGYNAADIQARNSEYDWSWSVFADKVDATKTGGLVDRWRPIDWVAPQDWPEPWDQDPPRSFDPWVYSDWELVYNASPKFKAKWDAWAKAATDSQKAGITAHVSGLLDPMKFPEVSTGFAPSRADVERNNWHRAQLARTRFGFYSKSTPQTTASEMAAQASAKWKHPFAAGTLTSWAGAWGGAAHQQKALGLQWAALDRYGFDLSTVTTDGVTKPAGQTGTYFKVYNPNTKTWITLSFHPKQYAFLADYLSSQTTREKYMAALAGWNYGAAKQWHHAGVDKVAAVRGTRQTKAWCEHNGIHVYTKDEVDGLPDVKWSPVTETVSQRGTASATVRPSLAAGGGVHPESGANVIVVWRVVMDANAVLGAHGEAYPSMGGGGGEGEIMMPAGLGWEVAAFAPGTSQAKIAQFLGEGVNWVG